MTSADIAALTQASYKAMANAVEHAYLPDCSVTFAVLAARTATGDVLVVVRDQDGATTVCMRWALLRDDRNEI